MNPKALAFGLIALFAWLPLSCQDDDPDSADLTEIAGTEVIGYGDASQLEDYRFVRVDGISHSIVRVDALVLEKPDGTRHYATSVEALAVSSGEIDPTVALNEPDAFYAFNEGDTTSCQLEVQGSKTYLELTQGQSLVVRMGAALEEGDKLYLLDAADCDLLPGQAVIDDARYQVSIATRVDAQQWLSIFGGAGIGSATITDLPAQ